jgi:hypothetical protein
MNSSHTKRGLFRLWIVASVLWVCGAILWVHNDFCDFWSLPLWCGGFWDFRTEVQLQILLEIFGPPIAVFFLGLALIWAMKGFQRTD